MVVNTPTWHRLEKAVLPEHITDWDTGCKEAGIDWDVYADQAFTWDGGYAAPVEIPGWQAIRRDDTNAVLSIQQSSYALVPIGAFGEVIDTIAGGDLKYEAIFSLYEGRMIIALLYFDTPLDIPSDNGVTKTLQYLCMQNRFDGNGGIRGLPTSIRTICANTVNLGEALDGKTYGFSIAHTSNWNERVEQAAALIRGARRDGQAWAAIANRLALAPIGPQDRERFLGHFLPTATDMTDRQVHTVTESRDAVRMLFGSTTNVHNAGNAYGLVTTATEWVDHIRAFRTEDSLVARQLVRKEPLKARAVRIACDVAGVNRRDLVAAVH